MNLPLPPASEFIKVPETIALDHGSSITEPVIAIEQHGPVQAAPIILVFTGITPSAHICSSPQDPTPGWWEYMVGSGKTIDTEHYRVICVNTLGSCHGSTGPASINPDTGKIYGNAFPDITIWDIARVTAMALQQIDVVDIDTVIGPSMGGMVALAYVLLQAGKVRQMINISSALESGPYSIAIRSLQRAMVKMDPEFENEEYRNNNEALFGLTMARKLGLISYRSADEWRERFGREREEDSQTFKIESYLRYNADKFAQEYDPVSYLRLSQAMDWFSAHEYKISLKELIQQSQLHKAHIIGVDTDVLFPVHQQKEMAHAFTHAGINTSFHEVESVNGHDAFLADEENFKPLLKQALV